MPASVLPVFDCSPLGESVTAGMECILGSAMYLKSTGISLKKTQSAVSTLEDGVKQKPARTQNKNSKEKKEKHPQL